MKKTISFIIAFIMLISVANISAFASQYVDISLDADELYSDASKTIEQALQTAKNNASENLIYRIYVPSGTYTLTSALHIYSNTQLYLANDTVMKKGFAEGNMIKAGLKGEENSQYNGYKNIVIDGGTWDVGFNGSSCAMRFAHCTNLSISNLTVSNILNSHHIEVAAVDGFNLTNCTFNGFQRTNSSSCEAVQIDVMHEYVHFPDYEKYDDTPCKNVTISGCTFSDLYSAIGTRSGAVGSYFENINIINNTFSNIKEKAISCFNYKNSKISGNIISNSTSGIVFEYFPSSNISDKLFMPNDDSVSPKIDNNSMSEISSNIITVNKVINTVDSCGITVYGGVADSITAQVNDIPQGEYYVENLSISNNNIACYNTASRGIFLTGVIDNEITGNTLVNYSGANNGINAINLCASSKNTLENNTISGGFNNAISLYSNDSGIASKSNTISSNSISGLQSYGVIIASGSNATIKNNNVISNCGLSLIRISGQNQSPNMAIANVKKINVSSRGRAVLRWKAVDGASGYKIYRSYSSNGIYKQIGTVKNGKLYFEDKTSRPGMTYYYKISPYKNVASSVIIGSTGAEKAIVL